MEEEKKETCDCGYVGIWSPVPWKYDEYLRCEQHRKKADTIAACFTLALFIFDIALVTIIIVKII